jgi:hypothetical protein
MYRLAKFGIVLTVAALACWTASVLADPPLHDYRDSVSGQVDSLVPISPGPPPGRHANLQRYGRG